MEKKKITIIIISIAILIAILGIGGVFPPEG